MVDRGQMHDRQHGMNSSEIVGFPAARQSRTVRGRSGRGVRVGVNLVLGVTALSFARSLVADRVWPG